MSPKTTVQGLIANCDEIASLVTKPDLCNPAELADSILYYHCACQEYLGLEDSLWNALCRIYPYSDIQLNLALARQLTDSADGIATLFSLFTQRFLSVSGYAFLHAGKLYQRYNDGWIGTLYDSVNEPLPLIDHSGVILTQIVYMLDKIPEMLATLANKLLHYHHMCKIFDNPDEEWQKLVDFIPYSDPAFEGTLLPYLLYMARESLDYSLLFSIVYGDFLMCSEGSIKDTAGDAYSFIDLFLSNLPTLRVNFGTLDELTPKCNRLLTA